MRQDRRTPSAYARCNRKPLPIKYEPALRNDNRVRQSVLLRPSGERFIAEDLQIYQLTKRHYADTEGEGEESSESPCRKRALYPPLKARSVKFRQIRGIQQNLIRLYRLIAFFLRKERTKKILHCLFKHRSSQIPCKRGKTPKDKRVEKSGLAE